MLGLGPLEMVVILVIALLVIGPRRLPEVLRTVGRVMAELRRTSDEVRREIMFDDELRDVRDMLDPYSYAQKEYSRPKLKSVKAEKTADAEEEYAGPDVEDRESENEAEAAGVETKPDKTEAEND